MKDCISYRQTKVYFEVYGEGEKNILFLHGWGCDGRIWESIYQKIKMYARCITIDFPPFGKSSEPTQIWTIQDYANITLCVLKKLKIHHCFVVAHSFGGRVSILLSSQTKIVQKMVLTGCAGIRKFDAIRNLKIFAYKIKKLLCKCGLLSKKILAHSGSPEYKALSPVMKKTFSNIVQKNLSDLCNYITCDTLLLWGECDKSTPLSHAKTLRKKIRNSKLLIYEGDDHFAFLRNVGSFTNAIINFFGLGDMI